MFLVYKDTTPQVQDKPVDIVESEANTGKTL